MLESQESRIPLQWKKNSCESINHILQLNQDWKPELINKIHKEIVLQESLVNGALYGHGDYELNSSVSHLHVDHCNIEVGTLRHFSDSMTEDRCFNSKSSLRGVSEGSAYHSREIRTRPSVPRQNLQYDLGTPYSKLKPDASSFENRYKSPIFKSSASFNRDNAPLI